MSSAPAKPQYEVMVDALESMAANYLMQDVPGLGRVLVNDYTSAVELCLSCLYDLGHVEPVGSGNTYWAFTEKAYWKSGWPFPDMPAPKSI